MKLSTPQLLEIYNQFADTPVARFSDRKTAERRVKALLESKGLRLFGDGGVRRRGMRLKDSDTLRIRNAALAQPGRCEDIIDVFHWPLKVYQAIVRLEKLWEHNTAIKSTVWRDYPRRYVREYIGHCVTVGALEKVEDS